MMPRHAGERRVILAVLACLIPPLAACGQDVSVNFRTGELLVSVRAGELGVPDTLREDTPSGAVVGAIPCAPCPTLGALPMSCVDGFCDPDPLRVSVPLGPVVDFDALRAGLELPVGRIDEIRLRGGSWQARSNTLTLDLPGVEIWWAPEGTASGVTVLARLGDLRAGSGATGELDVDAAGEAQLSAYLAGTAPRAQFFVELTLDIAPGQPFPEGDLELSVLLDMTATGPLL